MQGRARVPGVRVCCGVRGAAEGCGTCVNGSRTDVAEATAVPLSAKTRRDVQAGPLGGPPARAPRKGGRATVVCGAALGIGAKGGLGRRHRRRYVAAPAGLCGAV